MHHCEIILIYEQNDNIEINICTGTWHGYSILTILPSKDIPTHHKYVSTIFREERKPRDSKHTLCS